jgi:hypothetical protein
MCYKQMSKENKRAELELDFCWHKTDWRALGRMSLFWTQSGSKKNETD